MKKILLFLFLMCGALHGAKVFKPAEMLFFKGVDDDNKHLQAVIEDYKKAYGNNLYELDLSYTKVTRKKFEFICKQFKFIGKMNLRGCKLIEFADELKKPVAWEKEKRQKFTPKQTSFVKTFYGKRTTRIDVSEIGDKYFGGHGVYLPVGKFWGMKEIILEGGSEIKFLAEILKQIYDKYPFHSLNISKHNEFFFRKRGMKYNPVDLSAFKGFTRLKKVVAKNIFFQYSSVCKNFPRDITYLDLSGCANLGIDESITKGLSESVGFKTGESIFSLHHWRWNKIETLILDNSDVNDEALEVILHLLKLKVLRIHNTDVSIKFLEDLSKLHLIVNNITELSYSQKYVDLSRDDVQKLYEIFSKFKNLRVLEAPQLDSAKNLEALKNLKLEKFVAHKVAVGDGAAGYDFSGLEHIKGVKSLAFLGALEREQTWGELAKSVLSYIRKPKQEIKPGFFKNLTQLQELKVKGITSFDAEILKTLPNVNHLSVVDCGKMIFEDLYRFKHLQSLTLRTPFDSKNITLGKFQALQHIDLRREKSDILFEDTDKKGMVRFLSFYPQNEIYLKEYVNDFKTFPWETIVSDGKTNWHCGWGRIVRKELKFDRFGNLIR